MLSPEKVKSFLTNEDAEIRREAIHYFNHRHDRSMVSADDILDVVDQFGGKQSHHFLHHLDLYEQSDRSMQRMLAWMNDLERGEAVQASEVLRRLPLKWILKYRDEILALKSSNLLLSHGFHERLGFAGKSADELCQMLADHCAEEPDDWDDEYVARGNALVNAIAEFGPEMKHRPIEVLQQDRKDSWAELFAMRLLGALRAPELIEFAMPRLELYGDVGSDDLVDELLRVASPEVVARLEERSSGNNYDFAISAAEFLGRYPYQESQRLLLKLARDWEEDRSIPCYHLIRQFPDEPEVLEFLRPEASAQEIHFLSYAHLDEDMLMLGKMIGVEFPESDQWRTAKAKRGAMRLSRMLNDRADWEEKYPQEFPPPTPITAGAKVGRNDPCPCGSGKKYKKCCIDKAASE